MKTVNLNKLKGEIKSKGTNVSNLAREIGVTPSTLYRKLYGKNGESITIREASVIAKCLCLGKEDAAAIFFADNVADMRH